MAGNWWAGLPGGKSPFSGIQNPITTTSDLIKAIGNPNFWKRAIEVVLGIVLLAVGLDKMTTSIPIASQIAKAVK
jgi:hypothetical protein